MTRRCRASLRRAPARPARLRGRAEPATFTAWVAVARYQLIDARHRMAAAATRLTTDREDVGVLDMPLGPGFPAFVRMGLQGKGRACRTVSPSRRARICCSTPTIRSTGA